MPVTKKTPKKIVSEKDLEKTDSVTAGSMLRACARCGEEVSEDTLQIPIKPKRIFAACEKAEQGKDVRISKLDWICSHCAEKDLANIGSVSAASMLLACARCGKEVSEDTFRIAIEPKRILSACEKAQQGKNVRISKLDWICSHCAEKESRCELCGRPLAAMKGEFNWFIEDDGFIACNTFGSATLSEPIACINPKCVRYDKVQVERFHRRRRHAVGYQGFPDPYERILGKLGIEPGSEYPRVERARHLKNLKRSPEESSLTDLKRAVEDYLPLYLTQRHPAFRKMAGQTAKP